MAIGIIGAGLSGLTIGNFIKKNFLIIEKNKGPGGLCRSIYEGGFTFDYTSHIIFSKDKKILNYIKSLLKGNLILCKRNTKIFLKKGLIKYPFENGLSDLPLKDNLECVFYYLLRRLNKKPSNFKEWIYQEFGNGIAEKYLIPYSEKIWKTNLDEMDINWAKSRLPKTNFFDIIKSSLGFNIEGYKHQLHFYYPKKGGIFSLIKSLEKNVKGKIVYNFNVKKIYKKKNIFVVSNGKKKFKFKTLVLTIPLPEIIGALDNVPKDVLNSMKKLKFISVIAVMLGINKPKINNISWMYLPEKDILTNRVCFPFNFSGNVAPEGKSSLLAEISCFENDKIWKMKDNEIMSHIINKLHERNIIKKQDVCFKKLKRIKYAYLLYDKDYSKNLKKVKDFLKKMGFVLCGRFAEFEYMNMDHCIKNAKEKASEIR